MDAKEREARDLAEMIAVSQDTDVEPDNLAAWPDYDVYEWLEAWGYSWDGQGWIPGD